LTPVVARSNVWETAPVGGPEQPDFYNAAILLEWNDDPLALLDALLAIEAKLGRVREVRFGPRTIDLDILWIEGQTIDAPRLTVPHPRLHERAFAIAPLLEVAPKAPFVVPPGSTVERRMPL
jgi:2-amino-4-hydroxy-6-hydroxymethyldihydropteridine diphosphokinase